MNHVEVFTVTCHVLMETNTITLSSSYEICRIINSIRDLHNMYFSTVRKVLFFYLASETLIFLFKEPQETGKRKIRRFSWTRSRAYPSLSHILMINAYVDKVSRGDTKDQSTLVLHKCPLNCKISLHQISFNFLFQVFLLGAFWFGLKDLIWGRDVKGLQIEVVWNPNKLDGFVIPLPSPSIQIYPKEFGVSLCLHLLINEMEVPFHVKIVLLQSSCLHSEKCLTMFWQLFCGHLFVSFSIMRRQTAQAHSSVVTTDEMFCTFFFQYQKFR